LVIGVLRTVELERDGGIYLKALVPNNQSKTGKMAMHHMRKKYVLFLLICLIFWQCSENPSAPSSSVETITVAAYAGDSGLLVYLAKELGYYRQNGLNVIIHDFESGKQATDAMLAGQADISTAMDFVFVSNCFDHTDIRTIGTIAMAKTCELVARKDRGIITPKDVEGKTIGITRKSLGEFLLGRFLLFNNVFLEDVRIVDLTPNELIRAITSGQIDAVLTWDPNVFVIKDRLGKNAAHWMAQSGQDFNFILITRENWIGGHFLAGKQFLNALIQTEQYVQLNPTKTQAFIKKRFNYTDDFLLYSYSKHKFRVVLPQSLLLIMEDQAQWRIDNRLAGENKVPNFLYYIHADMLAEVKPENITVIR
jgi:NitT/TauT family transport system substrate-binding protein